MLKGQHLKTVGKNAFKISQERLYDRPRKVVLYHTVRGYTEELSVVRLNLLFSTRPGLQARAFHFKVSFFHMENANNNS